MPRRTNVSEKVLTPKAGDLQALERILGGIHVGTPDDKVRDLLMRRMHRVRQPDGMKLHLQTIENWVEAGLAIHRQNGEDFIKIAKGDFT